MEDYTWEKERDVIGEGDEAGANELVDEYWARLDHLESRRVLVEERTAEPLTDDEVKAMAQPAVLSYIAQARFELPRLLPQSTTGFRRGEFESNVMRKRGRTGQGECLVNTTFSAWQPVWQGECPATIGTTARKGEVKEGRYHVLVRS